MKSNSKRSVQTIFILLLICFLSVCNLTAQYSTIKAYPVESHELLLNPGIGFFTFQRFNGDTLNSRMGWTDDFPIVYQNFYGNLENESHPQTAIAYFWVNWFFLEIAQGEYNWDLIKTAAERGQTLMLHISPYEGDKKRDVPV